MRKERLFQILSILLLPYQEMSFCQEQGDVIENIRYSFARLRRRKGLSQNERKKRENAYYTSDRQLVDFLQKHIDWYPNTLDDFRMLLNLYFPEAVIADIYDQCLEVDVEDRHNIDIYYFHNIFRIAKSLLTFRDGKIAIRTWVNPNEEDENDIFDYPNIFDKVELWNLLGRMVVPDVFIIAFFIEAGLRKPHYLYRQTGGILLADKTLERILEKGVAETHIHMNAGIDYEKLWEEATNFYKWERILATEEEYEKALKGKWGFGFHIVFFRMFLAGFLEVCEKHPVTVDEYLDGCDMEKSTAKELLDALYCGRNPSYSLEWRAFYRQIQNHLIRSYGEIAEEDLLLDMIYRPYKKYNTYSEMIFLLKYMDYLREHPFDLKLLHLFFQYIRVKNNFYKKITQDNQIQGLANFRQYYSEMSKTVKVYVDRKRIELIFKSLSYNIHLKKLEIRIVPPVLELSQSEKNLKSESRNKELKDTILENVKIVLREYKNYIMTILNCEEMELKKCGKVLDEMVEKGKAVIPSIGIIFHFQKQDYVDNRIPDMCWIVPEKKIPVDSHHIIQWRRQMVHCAEVIEQLRSSIPFLAEYIVGIDAASEEHKVEPWVFAPVYAAIRNKKITKPVLLNNEGNIARVNNMGFTYHVGEEFRHILSGLRHVDEVIRFFHYKAGDRIGHGIVLGIDIDQWIEENEVVVMPTIEYLEDLLWIWGNVVHEEMNFDVSLDVLEGKILELAKQVYGEIMAITPNMLYDAYLKKFMSKYKSDGEDLFKKMAEELGNESGSRKEHFCKYYKLDNPYGIMWTVDKILCTHFCPIYYQRLHTPIMVKVPKSSASFLKDLQEKMIQKIEQMGIYVEINPTSNLAIGMTKSMSDSHIFKLNTKNMGMNLPSGHEVLVTVNSDDPMIFNTSCENELAYIYHALNYKGYGKESVLTWIDKVRQFGMDSSFIKTEKKPSRQLYEIDQLLEYIDIFQRRI